MYYMCMYVVYYVHFGNGCEMELESRTIVIAKARVIERVCSGRDEERSSGE